MFKDAGFALRLKVRFDWHRLNVEMSPAGVVHSVEGCAFCSYECGFARFSEPLWKASRL
jgi:hypothetical protein